MYKYLFSVLFPFIFSSAVSAQTWEIGIFGGSSAYMGDINPVHPLKIRNLALGGQVKRNFNPYWSLKLAYMHGKLEAADSESDNNAQRLRNISFYSDINELSLQTEFNFFKYVPSITDKRYTPYLFAGLSLFGFNPKTRVLGQEYNLREWGTEGQDPNDTYNTYALAVPYGAGIKYNITGQWSLTGEIGYRTAFTDYLDDVSGSYPDFTALAETDTRRILSDPSYALPSSSSGTYFGVYQFSPGTQRGDYRKRDTYMFIGITLSFTFISDKCPLAF